MKKAQGNISPSSESELLELISSLLPKPSRDVMTGIGDDCAVIRPMHGSKFQLLKTDALVEGIHFASGTPPECVGWKALCRPLSDIAAMGGSPLHAMITVAAPSSFLSSEWKALYRGIGKAAREFGVSVVGGETVRSPSPLFLSVSLTGTVPKNCLKLRNGAKPGDLICVTGKLGGSLKSGRHLGFTPRLKEGQWLGSRNEVTAMMDLSDGLGSDLPKLAAESRCSFQIDPDSLPRHRGCTTAEAFADGEDYELLLTVSPKAWPSLMEDWKVHFPSTPMACIGRMTKGDLTPTPLPSGYDHLRQTKS
ncbi:MAG: thiamine-phosphate kinase [Proteobacteria bacterium]|jgi:thiamine-monophosphate kinase|nr:thiamine-phosphate kinase [Pseudomonadota bacterium]